MLNFPNAVNPDDIDGSVPVGMHLTPADTGTDGIAVVVVHGECFGTEIRWFDEAGGIAVVRAGAAGLPVLQFQPHGQSHVYDKRGYETGTRTWWRYAEEADPASYREHCLRIVRKA